MEHHSHAVGKAIAQWRHRLSVSGARRSRSATLHRPSPDGDNSAPGFQTIGRLLTEQSGEKVALLGGVNVLLEPNDLSVIEGPHVRHLHFRGLA
jgi:hypothetical protein